MLLCMVIIILLFKRFFFSLEKKNVEVNRFLYRVNVFYNLNFDVN